MGNEDNVENVNRNYSLITYGNFRKELTTEP